MKFFTAKNMTIIFLTLTTGNLFQAQVSFVAHKTNGALEKEFLKHLKNVFSINVFIETGTYNGGTTEIAADIFDQVYTVELHEGMAKTAQSRFKNRPNVIASQGTSPEFLQKIIPTIDSHKRLMIFLDAHFCGDGTAVDKEGPNHQDGITAIRKEMEAIKQSGRTDAVIIVDDIRGFGSKINDQLYVGCWAYPSVQELVAAARSINEHYSCYLLGDMLLIFDARYYQLEFSEVVKACTMSRLFDGCNATPQQLKDAETIISRASGEEKEFIKQLCQVMVKYSDPEFHHHFWLGLIALNEGNSDLANQLFNEVKKRDQLFVAGYL